MKWSALLSCVLMFVGGISVAQFSVGVRSGVNCSTQKFVGVGAYPDFMNGVRSRAGFNGGLYIRWQPLRRFGIQSELLYSTQGSRVDHTTTFKAPYPGVSGSSTRETMNYDFRYINVPVLVQVHVIPALVLDFGSQLGFLRKATRDGFDADDRTANTDFGVALGGALTIKGVSAGARYTWGLRQVENESLYYYAARNRNFEIYAGYRLASWGKKKIGIQNFQSVP